MTDVVNAADRGHSSEFLIVAGLSGAGRSQAANHLEDLGWFVIDNLPPSLIPKVAELAAPGSRSERTALVVGTNDPQEVMAAIAELRDSGARLRILYLEAPRDVLVRRYEDTRRRHPLSTGLLGEAIDEEVGLLEPVRAEADVVIDTGGLNVHELRVKIIDLFGDPAADQLMRTTVTSFGYKHGMPRDVDLVFDCRFLPNPHWIEELR